MITRSGCDGVNFGAIWEIRAAFHEITALECVVPSCPERAAHAICLSVGTTVVGSAVARIGVKSRFVTRDYCKKINITFL